MTTLALRPPLLRRRDMVLGGVCAAVARHLGWSERAARFAALGLMAVGGGGALLYLWLWALVPMEQPADGQAAVRRSAPVAAILTALAGIAALIALTAPGAGDDRTASLALLVVTGASAGAVAWSLGFDRHDPGRTEVYGLIVRWCSVALLVIGGVGALVSRPSAVNAVVGLGMVVLGVAVVAAPRAVALWSALLDERTARVREVQRAEIAAHLHDSVLQTLALIQNRAGASSEVARIARAQERELREWLFAADEPVAADLATELRAIAAAIELDYPARIEVVTAGEPVERSTPGIAAAAREAMLNAARHAGGEVSVYLETSPGAIDVFVRDRGPGVDLASLPTDRLGIRESIVGRLTRAGGTATVRAGVGGIGTEVHLHLEVSRD